jgi:riboflavin synthase
MFTGLVETLGTVRSLHCASGGATLLLERPAWPNGPSTGESIAVNGACLTVAELAASTLSFQLGPETLAKTNLGELRSGDRVNLERALRVGDRLGGHWVQGHIDGIGRIVSRQRQGEFEIVAFACAAELTRLMVPKGSIAVDGVSLTVVDVTPEAFTVMLIPHTLAETTLGCKAAGATVNLETDILGKYAAKLLAGEFERRNA